MYSAPSKLVKEYWRVNESKLKEEYKSLDDFQNEVLSTGPEMVERMATELYENVYAPRNVPLEKFEHNANLPAWRDEQPSWLEVVGSKIATRAMDLGAGMATTVDAVGDWLEEKVPLGGIDFDKMEYLSPDEYKKQQAEGKNVVEETATVMRNSVPEYGLEDYTSWEEFKEAPATLFIPFAMEHGLASLPDMAAAVVNLPAYVLARTGEIGTDRAANQMDPDRDPMQDLDSATIEDLVYSFPTAVGVSVLERIGAAKMFGLTDTLKDTTIKEIAKAGGRRSLAEGATEAVQEPTEQVGAGIDTKRWEEMSGSEIGEELLQASAQGAVVGLGFGGTVGTATAGVQAARRGKKGDEDTETEELTPEEQELVDEGKAKAADVESVRQADMETLDEAAEVKRAKAAEAVDVVVDESAAPPTEPPAEPDAEGVVVDETAPVVDETAVAEAEIEAVAEPEPAVEQSVESMVLEEEVANGTRRTMSPADVQPGDRVVVDDGVAPPETGVVEKPAEGLVRVIGPEGAPLAVIRPDNPAETDPILYTAPAEEADVELETATAEMGRLIKRVQSDPMDKGARDSLQKLRNSPDFQKLPGDARDVVDDFLRDADRKVEEAEVAAKAEPEAKPEPAPEPAPEPEPAAEPEPTPEPTPEPEPEETAAPPKAEPGRPAGEPREVLTPAGRRVEVAPEIVEAADLIASHDEGGTVNPDFPEEVQPRDRSRKASQAQINEMAANLEPDLLMPTAQSSEGAPIIGDDNVVESGNARTLAIAKAYRDGGAEGYRGALEKQGYDVAGMDMPVLVQRRTKEMTPEERAEFAREANARTTADRGASEVAASDAESLGPEILERFAGGQVTAADNREFVRQFVDNVVPSSERASMTTANGELSQQGVQRIENAMFMGAYGEPEILSRLREDTDTNIKAIGTAMIDAAPEWAAMRSAAAEERIDPKADVTEHLVEAVNLVRKSRDEGQPLTDLVNQTEMFTGEAVDPLTEGMLRIMYKDPGEWKEALGAARTADAMRDIVSQANKTVPGENLFGEETDVPGMLDVARKTAVEGLKGAPENQTDTIKSEESPDFGEGLEPAGGGGGGPTGVAPQEGVGEASPPESGRSAPAEEGGVEPKVAAPYVRYQRRLIHGTSAEFEAGEIQPGEDGLIHLSEKEIHDFKRDYRHEFDSDIDVDDMLELPDLRDWNPVAMAEAAVKAEWITPQEEREIFGSEENKKRVEAFDHVESKERWATELGYEDTTDLTLDQVISDAYDDGRIEESDLENYEAWEASKAELFKKFSEKGIRAFKYRNRYERSKEGGYSVAVLDPNILVPVVDKGAARRERSPRYLAEEEADNIRRDLREILGRIVPDAKLKTEDIDVAGAPQGATITGMYEQRDGEAVIHVALKGNPRETLRHEAIHALKNMGLFTKAEWSALRKSAESKKWIEKHGISERYPGMFSEDGSIDEAAYEEAIADEFAGWVEGRKDAGRGTAVRRMFERMREFFREMAQRLRVYGATPTPGNIFDAVERGEVGARQGTETPAFKEWFGDSKVVDKSGEPIRVYHGTGSDFSVFKNRAEDDFWNVESGFYFTDSTTLADLYSTRRKDTENRPNIMPVYLSIKNPKRIHIPAKKPKNRKRLSEHQTPGDIEQAKAEGYDGFHITYAKTIGETKPTNVWIAFEPTQIKSATGNTGTFDPSNPDIRFSRSAGPRMRATHGLSASNLEAALKRGTLIAPSVAVTPEESPHEWGGKGKENVSLVFRKGAISPSGWDITEGDAWTPTHPKVEKRFRKIGDRDAAEEKITEDLKAVPEELMTRYFDGHFDQKRIDGLKEHGFRLVQSGEDTFEIEYLDSATDGALALIYLNQTGKTADQISDVRWSDDFKKWREQYVDKMSEGAAEDVIWAGTTNMGRNRYVPATPANILKDMRKQAKDEYISFGAHGAIWAKWRPKKRTVSDMREAAGRVAQDKEAYEAQKEVLSEELMGLGGELAAAIGHTDRSFDVGLNILLESGPRRDSILRVAKDYARDGEVDISEDLTNRIQEHFDKVKTMPLQFLEAKRLKEVPISDVAGAMVRPGAPKSTLDALERAGIPVTEVAEDANPEEVAAAQSSFEGALFRVEFQNPETEKRWQEASKGVTPTKAGRISEAIRQEAKRWTRSREHLPNEAKFSDAREKMVHLEQAEHVAKEEISGLFEKVMGKLEQPDIDLLTRKMVLDDLLWTTNQGMDLPFGLKGVEDVMDALHGVEAAIEAKPELKERLAIRTEAKDKLKDSLISNGVLNAKQARNPNYFRHQVLEYAQLRATGGVGGSGKVKSPYVHSRKGSEKDINANYFQAEADWMYKAHQDIATAKFLNWLRTSQYNRKKEFANRAREENNDALNAKLKEDPTLIEKYGKPTKNLEATLDTLRKTVAARADAIRQTIPKHLVGEFDRFVEGGGQRSIKNDAADNKIFGVVAHLAESDLGMVNSRAAAVLSAVSKRRRFLADTLGDQYINPQSTRQLVERYGEEDGLTIWQPDSHDGKSRAVHIFTGKTVTEHVLDRAVDKLDQVADGIMEPEQIAELKDMLQNRNDIRMIGGPMEELVIPQEVADTLNDFHDEGAANMLDALTIETVGRWKQWTLFNPARFAKYYLNNMTGDFDALLATPAGIGVARKIPQAWREVKAMIKTNELTDGLRESLDKGVVQSSLVMQEITARGDLARESFRPTKVKGVLKYGSKYFDTVQNIARVRESAFRYAAYLHYKEEFAKGKTLDEIGYGASPPWMVEGITDPIDKAARMARDLLGDYGSIPHRAKWARTRMIPFVSWIASNTTRYNNLFLNAYRTGRDTSKAKGVGMGTVAAGSLLGRMFIFYAAVNLFNNFMFPDEEESLGTEERLRLHLILGKWGDEVQTLRFQGALSDYLGWFGLEDAGALLSEVQKGRASVPDVIKAIAKAPFNKIGQAVTPTIKIPLELGLGMQFFPDMFEPRKIRDPIRHFSRNFSLDAPTAHAMKAFGKSAPTKSLAKTAAGILIYSRDPGQIAYDVIKAKEYRFLEKETGASGGGRMNPKSKALYNWRRAKKMGDKRSEELALKELRKYPRSGKSLRSSIKRAAPLGALTKNLRRKFIRTLSPKERDQLRRATQHYNSLR